MSVLENGVLVLVPDAQLWIWLPANKPGKRLKCLGPQHSCGKPEWKSWLLPGIYLTVITFGRISQLMENLFITLVSLHLYCPVFQNKATSYCPRHSVMSPQLLSYSLYYCNTYRIFCGTRNKVHRIADRTM